MTDRQTGGSNDYYKVFIANPTTLAEPYQAECNDIIEALGLNFAEANILKALWRISAYRRGLQQKAEPLYDAEKIEFYARRVLTQQSGEDVAQRVPSKAGESSASAAQGDADAAPSSTPQRRGAGDALREKLSDPAAMQRVTERAAERQDAMLERREPEGWKLVPVEPTGAMWEAADDVLDRAGAGICRVVIPVWDAMLAAAPQPEEGESDD